MCSSNGRSHLVSAEGVRFWAVAIISLALISYLVSTGMVFFLFTFLFAHISWVVPDTDSGKHAFAVGMSLYHAVFIVLCGIKFPDQFAVGAVVHALFFAAFISYLKDVNYF